MSDPDGIEVVPVDPSDDDGFVAWHRVYETSSRHELGDLATPWQLEELRATMRDSGSRAWSSAWSGPT